MQTTLFQDESLKQFVAEFTGKTGNKMECVNEGCPFVNCPRSREPDEVSCGFCKQPLRSAADDATEAG